MTKLLSSLAIFIFKNRIFIIITWLISMVFFGYINLFFDTNNIEAKIEGAYNTDAHKVELILKNDFKINQEASLALVIKGKDKN